MFDNTYKMKAKIIILALSGLFAGCLAVSAQDITPAPVADTATHEATTAAAPVVAQTDTAPDTAPTATPTDTAPATVQTDSAPAPVSTQVLPAVAQTDTAPVLAQAETAPAAPAAQVESAPAQTPASTPAEPLEQTPPVIPLIVMDDVPLTDAIKNLARQANLNYMLDPKISFGQPGPDGKPIPQPVVSIRWENVTAVQALNALLGNYGLQLVDDSKTKIARITTQDPAAPPVLLTKIIQLKYASPSNLVMAVQSSFSDKRSKVIADTRSSQLVLVSTEKEQEDVDKMIERLDTPTKQVLIETKMVETSMNPSTTKGIDWSGTLKAQTFRVGNNLQSKTVTSGDSDNKTVATAAPKLLFDTAGGFNPGTAFLDADGVTAVFSFFNNNSEAKVISAPRTVTLDNEMATISVTRQIPILTTSPSSANTPGATSITYSNLGVILNVTPRISANDTVNLKVIPQVSRVFSKDDVLSGGQLNTVYTFDARVISTMVVIPSGHTLVMGGLVQDDVRTGNSKVPGLGDLPLLGRAFRTDTKSRDQKNLLVFITPTIVGDSDFRPAQTAFFKSVELSDKEGTEEWSAWDSGKPRDWSKRGKRN